MDVKEHWDRVYSTKQIDEVSWYQKTPTESLSFFKELNIEKSASIIDIGGGDSFLVDHLLENGYNDITVLDISESAINKARVRLGEKAKKVKWIAANVLDIKADMKFDCWHDRAAFHFLTETGDVENYISLANEHLNDQGKLIVGTFSTEGPEKCSGLPVKQYNESMLSKAIQKWFSKIKCITTDHVTPFNTVQNFLFCSFQKIK